MAMWFDVLLEGMRKTVAWCKMIEVFQGVSLWSFCISCLLVAIILSGLVSVVRVRLIYRSYSRKE